MCNFMFWVFNQINSYGEPARRISAVYSDGVIIVRSLLTWFRSAVAWSSEHLDLILGDSVTNSAGGYMS